MDKKFNIYEPKFGDSMWIEHYDEPKEVHYDYMYGWNADVDDYDRPHVIIDWPFVLFDKFSNDVIEYYKDKHYYEIGFTNENACRKYCNWKNDEVIKYETRDFTYRDDYGDEIWG